MAISRKLLNEGEEVVVSARTHVKALVWPLLLLIVLAALGGFLATLPQGDAADVLQLVIGIVTVAAIAWFCGRPFLAWLTTTYTITTRRLITRTGILTRRGHDIPLSRIADVTYEHGLLDRILGCGTLLVSDASQRGPVVLHDVPNVEQVHLQMSDLLHEQQGGHPYGGRPGHDGS